MVVICKHMTENEFQQNRKKRFLDVLLGAFITTLVVVCALYTHSYIMYVIAAFVVAFEGGTLYDYCSLCVAHDEIVDH